MIPTRWFQPVVEGLLGLIFPGHCLCCGRLLAHGSGELLCGPCLAAIDWDGRPTCPRCAATVGPSASTTEGCLYCRRLSLGFQRAYRLGPYTGRRREAVLAAKQPAGEAMGRLLGRLLGRRLAMVADEGPAWHLVVPVPVAGWRRWLSPFNPAQLLAEEVGRALHVPVEPRILRRVKDRPPQPLVSRTQRFENVRGAFRAWGAAGLRGRRVLLVDDILTTGATADATSRCLKAAGAAAVDVAVVARAGGES